MQLQHTCRLAFVTLIAFALFSEARSIEIELSFADEFATRPAARIALERAATVWERTLRDPVTLQISIVETDSAELGDAQSATELAYDEIDYSYADFRAALVADGTSDDDSLAISHLQLGPQMVFRGWYAEMVPGINSRDDWVNNYVSVPRSVAKSLDLPHMDEGPDATIYWNSATLDNGFDFDRSDGIVGTDFQGVAMHEIGHALGFSSTIDLIELVHSGEIPIPPEVLAFVALVEPLDLFRFSGDSVPYFDLTPGGAPYFSIDGGETNLAAFTSGAIFGDGGQSGHWFDDTGIMDSFLEPNRIHHLTDLDRLSLDVIGWDLALEGDFNGDGVVDAADYTVWRDGLGTQFEQNDYDRWKENFGRSMAGGRAAKHMPTHLTSSKVPEPTAFLLAVVSMIAYGLKPPRYPHSTTPAGRR